MRRMSALSSQGREGFRGNEHQVESKGAEGGSRGRGNGRGGLDRLLNQ